MVCHGVLAPSRHQLLYANMLEIAVCEARNEQRIREVVGVHLAGQSMVSTCLPIALACLIRSPAMFGINGPRHLMSISNHNYHSFTTEGSLSYPEFISPSWHVCHA